MYMKKHNHEKLTPIEKQKESSNKQMWVNHNIIDKLNSWKVLDIDGKGKNMLIKLNGQGQDMIRFL